jgi:hypothetical protein
MWIILSCSVLLLLLDSATKPGITDQTDCRSSNKLWVWFAELIFIRDILGYASPPKLRWLQVRRVSFVFIFLLNNWLDLFMLWFWPPFSSPLVFIVFSSRPHSVITDRLYVFLYIICVLSSELILSHQKLMCPIQFQSFWFSWIFLMAYSRVKLNHSDNKASVCGPFSVGNAWDMFSYMDFAMGFILTHFNLPC